ncbi:MAG: tryptophan--tRNA ligase [Candidatus Peribacteraceae bacterium]
MRILSGIQPSGQLHLGNYFGSMKPNLDFVQPENENFFFIADLHALTTLHDRAVLAAARQDIIRDYLAVGFDPSQAIIYEQSSIPAHTELSWILASVTPMGLLERAVSYKDKVQRGLEATAGLFTYPVLMAADILLYQADVVPVGSDQKQHVEITRDIAVKFNNAYGEIFTVPEPQIRASVAVVPGTDGKKMSKSYGNTIPLFADEDAIRKAIMGIVTDSKGQHDPKDPDTCIVYVLHRLLLSEDNARVLAEEYKNGLSYGEAKKRFLEDYMDFLMPMRERRRTLRDADVRAVLDAGTAKAAAVAGETMRRVRSAVGLN